MITESKEIIKKRHTGRNLQRIRKFLGVKQEALAADLGIGQQEVSKIEKQDTIEEELLSQIANILGVSSLVISNFDEEKIISNINNTQNVTFEHNSTSVSQEFNPFDLIVELYKRLLKSEKEKIKLLDDR